MTFDDLIRHTRARRAADAAALANLDADIADRQAELARQRQPRSRDQLLGDLTRDRAAAQARVDEADRQLEEIERAAEEEAVNDRLARQFYPAALPPDLPDSTPAPIGLRKEPS